MAELILIVQAFSTLSMVGVIWFVQIVHYPLFRIVGSDRFAEYERCHQQLTTSVVAPLMIVEASTAVILIFWQPGGVSTWLPWAGAVLVALLWCSTFLVQAPAHAKLAGRFDPVTHRRLVRSNWLRTVGWTFRGLIVCAMVWQIMRLAG